MGIITSLIGMKQQRDQNALDRQADEKRTQTAQAFAVIQALDHARGRDDRLADDFNQASARAIEIRNAITVASQGLANAQRGGTAEEQRRKQTEYDGLLSLSRFQDSVVGDLAGKRQRLSQHMDQLGQFLSKEALFQDALGMKQMIEQARQPTMQQQAQGPTPQEGAAPQQQEQPQQQAVAPTDEQRMNQQLQWLKGANLNASIDKGQLFVDVPDDREMTSAQQAVAALSESLGVNISPQFRSMEGRLQTETTKRKRDLMTASEQAPALKSRMKQAGLNMELGADDLGTRFMSITQETDEEGNVTQVSAPATFGGEGPGASRKFAESIDAAVTNAGGNIEILKATNRLAADSQPLLEKGVQSGDFVRRGNDYVVNPFSGQAAANDDKLALAASMFELQLQLQGNGITPAITIRTPEPEDAAQMFKQSWAGEGGKEGNLESTAESIKERLGWRDVGDSLQPIAAAFAADLKNLGTFLYGTDGTIPPGAAKEVLETVRGSKDIQRALQRNSLLRKQWSILERDLKAAVGEKEKPVSGTVREAPPSVRPR